MAYAHAGVASFVITPNVWRSSTALDDLHCCIPKMQSALPLVKKHIFKHTRELLGNVTDFLFLAQHLGWVLWQAYASVMYNIRAIKTASEAFFFSMNTSQSQYPTS